MRRQPDAVLVSGDLADNATDAEYERVRELLAPLRAALYVLPGNHDDRRALRRHFGVPGADGDPVQYAVDLGSLRLVVLDTTRPGEDPGALDAERLGWLDAELSRRRRLPRCSQCTIRHLSPGSRRWTTSACPPPIGGHSAKWSSATGTCDGSLPVTSTARSPPNSRAAPC